MCDKAIIVGAGLAGSEAAWQLAKRGVQVTLYEMRPHTMTPAHKTDLFAELVCSNSFKSLSLPLAAATLKNELEIYGSFLLEEAKKCSVRAGNALAVEREKFSSHVTMALTTHPNILVVREEVKSLDYDRLCGEAPVIIATGPLTSDTLHNSILGMLGAKSLSFFDAAAPIVTADSLDHNVLFSQSRYCEKDDAGDYLNAPFSKEQYESFILELLQAKRAEKRDFESGDLFSACQPIEEVARSGVDAPRFGALKPVGLRDPHTQKRPWAVVQLRAENSNCSAYNLVGFQTNLTFAEQKRVFGMIPGLENADFVRYGVMHRNTFLDAPHVLGKTLEVPSNPRLRFAGQITGTEGYTEAIASGLFAALSTISLLKGLKPPELPVTTTFGALLAYATDNSSLGYQPMHVNYGIMPQLDNPPRGKKDRYLAYSGRAINAARDYRNNHKEFWPSLDII